MSIFGFLKINLMKIKKDVGGLIKLLEYGKDISTRSNAARALGEIGDKKSVIPLIKTLDEKDYKIKREAVYALGKIGDLRAMEPLDKIINEMKGKMRVGEWMHETLGEDYGMLIPKLKQDTDNYSDIYKSAKEAIRAIKRKKWENIPKNDRYFFKQCEKFIVFGARKEIQRLGKEIKKEEGISEIIHRKIRENINKKLAKNEEFLKNGENLLKNLYKRRSIYSKFKSQLDNQIQIIDNIKKYAEKIEVEFRKKQADNAIYLVGEYRNISEEMAKLRTKLLNLEEEAGKYAIDYGKGLILKSDFINKYDNLGQESINISYEIEDSKKKLNKVIDEIINNFINIGIIKLEK